jgi:hypothetical protein
MTRAELFRYVSERSGAKSAPSAPRAAVGDSDHGRHHPSARAGKKAQYAFELSEGPPSRKSSRKGANRQKNDVQFRMRRQASEGRPEDRARGLGR